MFDPTDVADDPSDLGVDPGKLDALVARAQREVDEGRLPSCQLAVARHGRLVALQTLGAATNETRYVMFSATKAIVASAAWLLIGEGKLDPGAKVVEYIPEFATNGKDVITVEQVMLHTSGFPHAPMPPSAFHDRAARIERFKMWRLNWEPGSRFEYHPTSAHWVLAELIERASGTDFRDYIRRRIALPSGLPNLRLGVPEEEQDGIAPLAPMGEVASEDELEALFGIRVLPVTEVTEEALLGFNSVLSRSAGVPGSGAISTAAELALFYQALLHNPDRLWDPQLLADVTGHVRCTFVDPMTRVPANRSLGLVLAGNDGHANRRHILGNTVSPRAFGHAGAGGQIAWADPDSGLSFAFLTNGLERNVIKEGRRGIALSSRAGLLTAAGT
jgi:CubicO group peptidase (beta-lactamase class C family)